MAGTQRVVGRVVGDEDGAWGYSGPLWVTVDINGMGLFLKEGCGWITKGVEGRSGGEFSLSLCSQFRDKKRHACSGNGV